MPILHEKPTPMPAGHIKEIVLSNSPVTEEVYNAIVALNLPSGIMDQINSAQVGISGREETERKIIRLQAWIYLYEAELVKYYLADGDQTNFVATLQNSSSVSSRQLLTDWYVSGNDVANANATLGQISTNQSYASDPEIIDYITLMNRMIGLKVDGKSVPDIDAGQEASFRNLAGSPTAAGARAKFIIGILFNENPYVGIPDIPADDMAKWAEKRNTSDLSTEAAALSNLYPNPNDGTMW